MKNRLRGQATVFFGLMIAIAIVGISFLLGVGLQKVHAKAKATMTIYVESADSGAEMTSLLLSEKGKPFMQILGERNVTGRNESEIAIVNETAKKIDPYFSIILFKEGLAPGTYVPIEQFGFGGEVPKEKIIFYPPLRMKPEQLKQAITSEFGEWRGYMHRGIDFAVEIGTTVQAIEDGEVIEVGKGCIDVRLGFNCLEASPEDAEKEGCNCNNGNGNFVVLKHNIYGNIFYSYYLHLSSVTVDKGDEVYKGQEIGKSGNTGRTTGPHLHFELRKDSMQKIAAVDPSPYLGIGEGKAGMGGRWSAEIPLPGARPGNFKISMSMA